MNAERQTFIKDAHLKYLDTLRETGITNMYGATPYLRNAYKKLTREQASAVVSYWMRTFSERHALDGGKDRL